MSAFIQTSRRLCQKNTLRALVLAVPLSLPIVQGAEAQTAAERCGQGLVQGATIGVVAAGVYCLFDVFITLGVGCAAGLKTALAAKGLAAAAAAGCAANIVTGQDAARPQQNGPGSILPAPAPVIR